MIAPARLAQGLNCLGNKCPYPDFLVRTTDGPYGRPTYEPEDPKLAKKVKAEHLLQLGIYAELLEGATGQRPIFGAIHGGGLRITSALLKALERKQREVACGPEGLTVRANGETLAFTLYERSKVEPRAATAEERRWRPARQPVRATVPAGDLVCKIREPLSVQTEFKELKTPLEAQLPVIVASLEAGLRVLAERRRLRALEAERRA